MSAFDHVSFIQPCPYLPLGFAATGWKTRLPDSAEAHYHFDGDGQLRMTSNDRRQEFITHDACGAFLVYSMAVGNALYREHWVSFHNGRLFGVMDIPSPHAKAGFLFTPTWELDIPDEGDVRQAADDRDLDACVQLIRAASADPAIKAGSESAECMVGLALCIPERLAGISPAYAWSKLTPQQSQAITSWFRY